MSIPFSKIVRPMHRDPEFSLKPVAASATWLHRALLLASLILTCAAVSGCSTLSSLGLPFGSTANPILDSAKAISESPGRSLQLPRELETQPLENYLVEIGDTLFIEAVNFDATIRLPGDQIIQPDGTISVGEFGSWSVVKKSVEQIQAEVQSIIDVKTKQDLEAEFAKEQLRDQQTREDQTARAAQDSGASRPDFELADVDAEDIDVDSESAEARRQRELRLALERRIEDQIGRNKISVRLVNWDSQRFYVLGEVNSPGFFRFTGNQTVLDAIIEAGGLSSKANHHQIIVSRPTPCGSCRIVMKICYDQIVQLGDASTNYQLRPGDRVFVPGLTLIDDIRNSLKIGKTNSCPRCADCQTGCDLPTGCGQVTTEYSASMETDSAAVEMLAVGQ
jgi:polysaccharide export outer membrane protein